MCLDIKEDDAFTAFMIDKLNEESGMTGSQVDIFPDDRYDSDDGDYSDSGEYY